jgi:hypothetical protein
VIVDPRRPGAAHRPRFRNSDAGDWVLDLLIHRSKMFTIQSARGAGATARLELPRGVTAAVRAG